MANNFNELNFEINAKDNASKVLEKVAKNLKKIKDNSQGQSNSTIKEVPKKTIDSYTKLGLKLGSITIIARKLGKTFVSLIKESSSYIENLNLFAVTFGKNYKDSLNWSLNLAKNFGLASNEVVRFTGLFKQLSTAIGITAQTGDVMSRVLTQFGYDIASLFNIDITNAMQKLQAGIFSGQTKPLRSVGIDVTYQTLDNLLKTNNALKGFGVSSKQLDQAQKSIARLIVALQSGQNAFGDMARSINTTANQIRVFQGTIANLKLALGDALSNSFNKAIIGINGFLIGITEVIRSFVPMKDLPNEIADSLDNMTNSAEETSDAINDINGSLASFDKFNVLGGAKTSFFGGDVAITEALTQELLKQKAIYDEQLKQVNNINNKAIKIGKNIKDFFVETINGVTQLTGKAKLLGAVLGFGALGTILSKGANGNFLHRISLSLLEVEGVTSGVTNNVTLLGKSLTFLQAHPFIKVIGLVLTTLTALYIKNEQFRNSVNKLFKAISPIIEILTDALDTLISPISETLLTMGDTLSKILIPAVDLLRVSLIPTMFVLETILKLIQSIIIGLNDLFSLNWGKLIDNQKGIWSNWNSVNYANKNIPGFEGSGVSVADANFIKTPKDFMQNSVRQNNASAFSRDSSANDVMTSAVELGVLKALSSVDGQDSESSTNRTLNVYIGGDKVFSSIKKEANRNGYDFVRV